MGKMFGEREGYLAMVLRQWRLIRQWRTGVVVEQEQVVYGYNGRWNFRGGELLGVVHAVVEFGAYPRLGLSGANPNRSLVLQFDSASPR